MAMAIPMAEKVYGEIFTRAWAQVVGFPAIAGETVMVLSLVGPIRC